MIKRGVWLGVLLVFFISACQETLENKKPITCPADTKVCPESNRVVSRDPSNNCNFHSCPKIVPIQEPEEWEVKKEACEKKGGKWYVGPMVDPSAGTCYKIHEDKGKQCKNDIDCQGYCLAIEDENGPYMGKVSLPGAREIRFKEYGKCSEIDAAYCSEAILDQGKVTIVDCSAI